MSGPQNPQFPQQPQYPQQPPYPQQQGYPPQQPFPPPQPPAKKGIPVWAWLIIGFMAFMLLIGIGGSIIAYMFVNKAQQMAKNPVSALARIAAATNPDIDVVDVDEKTGKVTIRDKKTGKTVTIDGDAIKDGKITIDTDEGHAELGAGANMKTPDWVFLPAGAKIVGGMTGSGAQGAGGTIVFNSNESLDSMKSFFEDKYRAAGYEQKASTTTSTGGDQAIQLMFQHEGRKRSVTIGVAKSGDSMTGSIVYGEGQ
jgi:hypothetical protein